MKSESLRPEPRMAYLARTPEGECVGVCADEPQFRTSTAVEVANWIRKGYTVERAPVATATAELEVAVLAQIRDRNTHGVR
jgi:hypothetical protein